ncbi:hypothetical protein G6F70_001067 [Rhizopus microsporus]|nr:hypothetical protein G6F71_007077 [Rhizopus microsporus]KAG1203764.1 hypothetical protein G6F70_001067 [Rhizopus microsporus]KAG1215493.1 hypothetical protein G6F69_000933 [Rhizopus microsporus]KAG1234910.1 hypothetical protein G6F67_003178 [Rhizopus microsporus]KAG1261869.1 hypothetical protein G6F68_006368 [Rhizopus microsporus]
MDIVSSSFHQAFHSIRIIRLQHPPTLYHGKFINKSNKLHLHFPVAQSFVEPSFDRTIRLYHNNELSSAVSCNYRRKITDHPASPYVGKRRQRTPSPMQKFQADDVSLQKTTKIALHSQRSQALFVCSQLLFTNFSLYALD